MKVTKPLQRILEEISEDGRPYWEGIGLQETLAQGVERALGPDDPLLVPSRMPGGLYAELSDDHWAVFKYVSQHEFDIPAANLRGAALRIHHDAPSKYAVHMALAARAQWLEAKTNWKYNWDELWRPLLCAAASHDYLAESRLLELWDNRGGSPNNRAYSTLCLGIAALARRDNKLLNSAVEEIRKRKCPSYVTGVNMALCGVQANDADLFAQGIEQMLKRFKAYMFNEAVLAIIEPFAHGIYELARRYSSDALRVFDSGRKLPWDAEYCQWITTVDDIAPELARLKLPPFLRLALIEMEDMEWAPDNRPKT